MKKNAIIAVESEDRPGIIERYLVLDTKDGYVKLMYQGEYSIAPHNRHQLIAFMKENNYTQQMLSDVLNVSRSTISRYLDGKRETPKWIFTLLGIKATHTAMQSEQILESIMKSCIHAKGELDKIVEIIEENK